MKIYNFFPHVKKHIPILFFIISFCISKTYGESPCVKSFSGQNNKITDTKIATQPSTLSPDGASYLTRKLRERLNKKNSADIFLTLEREKELIIKYRETGDQTAFEELLLSLIYYIRKNTGTVGYRWSRTDLIDDLLQETILTLVKGLEKYDINSDNRLSSYVFKNLQPTLHTHMRSEVSLIKTPRGVKKLPFFVSTNEPILNKSEGEQRDTLQDRLVDEEAIPIDDQVSSKEKTHIIKEAIDDIRGDLTELENAVLNGWLYEINKEGWDDIRIRFNIRPEKLRVTQLKLMRKLKFKFAERGFRRIF